MSVQQQLWKTWKTISLLLVFLILGCQSSPKLTDHVERTNQPTPAPAPKAKAKLNKHWALLIGVSEYPNHPQSKLNGPKNDVKALAREFHHLGVPKKQIIVLADGLKKGDLPEGISPADPTRAAIMSEFKKMISRAKSGKMGHLILHLSGHGARQPDLYGDEKDGLDEIFLPRDIGKWTKSIQKVKNAISDDEFDRVLTKIRRYGSNVFAIFDNCHSGTMTRGAPLPADIKFRTMKKKQLGIGKNTVVKRRKKQARQKEDLKGGYVAFYAASSQEETPEMEMEGVAHGLFTHEFLRALSLARKNNPNAFPSYQQIGAQILAQYQAMGWKKSTPQFEGTLLRKPFLNLRGTNSGRLQWRIKLKKNSWLLPAGNIHGLSNGAIIAIYSNAFAKDNQFLGHVQLKNVKSFESEMIPLDKQTIEKLNKRTKTAEQASVLKKIKPLSLSKLKWDYFGSPVFEVAKFELKLARPVFQEAENGPVATREQVKAANALLDKAIKGDKNLRVRFSAGSDAHIRVAVHQDSIIFMPPDAAWPQNPNHITKKILKSYVNRSIKKGSVKEIRNVLMSIAKVRNLLAINEQLMTSNNKAGVKTNLLLQKKKQLTISQKTKIKNGQKLEVMIKNTSKKEMDVTVLYVNSKYGIECVFPDVDDKAEARIPTGGQSISAFGGQFNSDSLGTEYFVVISIPVESTSEIQHFCDLQQPELLVTRSVNSMSQVNFQEMIWGAASNQKQKNDSNFFVASRGFDKKKKKKKGTSPSITVYSMEVSN